MLQKQKLKEFFHSLYGQCTDCKLGIMTLPDKQIRHYFPEQLEQFIADGQRLGAVSNTYFDVNPKSQSLKDGLRGGSEAVQYLCSLYTDIDVSGPAHKEKHLPETKDAALEHLMALPLQPTYVIDTGYGLQAYWVLEEPLRLESQDDWMKGDGILKGYGQFLTDHFAQKGWKLDPVFDLARMLRFPGSYNFKLDTPVQGDFLIFGGPRYTIKDFSEYMAPAVIIEKKPFEVDERVVGSADRIMERCKIAQQMLDDPDSVSEPLWYALCCNSVLTPDGSEKFHEWSSHYSGYDYDETEAKIVRAQEIKAPCTCEYFKSRLGCQCPEGGCGVKAPIVHALLSKDEQLQNLLSKAALDVNEVLDKYSLGLLYYAMENRPAEYLKFKMRVRKMGISIKDFERAVKSEAPKPEIPEFDDLPQAIQLDGLDLHGAVAPRGYRVEMTGVDTVSAPLSGLDWVPLCNDPVVISRRMENIDSGLERMELVFYRNGRWKTIIAPRADLLSKNSIIHYSDHGLPVNSCNSEGVVRYLTEYENENRSIIPFTRSINRIGWMNKEFYPYAVDQEIVFEDNEHTDLVRSLHECGDYDIWLETAGELRKNPFARTMLAASFASPMLEPLQNRVILLHCWHASRSGKTATLKFVISVWGDPIQLMGSFNSTAVGLERKAAILRNLPFGLDELQVLNERKLSPAQIVYSLGNGSGKTRGSRNGKLQETPTWRNCIICTGEQPISSESSMDGVNTRVLELYGQPISDPEYGRLVHQVSESNYGFAGKAFIQFLQQNILAHRGKLRQDCALLRDTLKEKFASFSADPGVHLDNVAVLALADYYASLALFQTDETTAWEEALDMGISILTNAKSLEPQDSIERAWDFVKDWVASNRTKFTNMAPECFGLVEGQCVYALANKLRQALESAGFSYTKSIKGFRERGYLVVTTDSDGKERNQCQKRMVADALDGKIDLIVTKSVSRFARNTVDSLTTVRKLKEAGVEVYFEKENIWTLDSKGELLITIMSSLAQEESRSISENVTWGQRKRFADGKVSIPYGQFLGYQKGADGLPEIVPEQAEIVRFIYRMCIEGKSTNAIAKHLTQQGIPTPAGKQVWQRATVESILRNEKYKGAALLQKKFTVDFLQKKMKVNEGEVPQYYVEHSHEAIIQPAEWEKAQLELARRKTSTRRTQCNSPFAGKIICGDCGEIFGSKVWHSNSKYRRTIWQCNAKYRNNTHCNTPHLYEDDLKQHFITVLSDLLTDREALLDDGRYVRRELLDFASIDSECDSILNELDVVAGMIKHLVNENAAQAQSQTAYIERYNTLVERYESLQTRYDTLQQQKEQRQIQADAISGCLFALGELDLLQITFSDELWNTVVDHVTVYEDERLVFRFKNGSEITVQI